ncbi:hypothetical protein LTR10_020897 [Elasticomyces elasticus]|uniref:CHK kinase-like domain-containing protein n=1 Tax=Exophiala sideris TaxID=1016849 RepID=A0ABR0IZM9_9EURO|nr:hypothetical protein LTR10_020897 [Elasticomyces elasticus]KAK5023390.1 hypothetical protein LTS07_009265 [Exophiala sideris]KAK5028234.1 hypothetical protein LTR13_009222 [Exophiala sideris]KAK5052892.1 hypothetical protein LTR69_009718 [Exophiala sideris]KAK5178503.1 hypothetical protein LTR44_009128 [Eurotiomycetes sp. CCFEE 6388]
MTSFSIEDTSLHLHALKLLEDSDRLLAYLQAGPEGEGVYRYDQITTEWLEQVLSNGVADARVTDWSRTGGHDGMTERHFLNITWNEAGQRHKLPTSVFIKATPDNAHLREMLSMLHMAELECNVYNICSEDLAEHIPRCYYAKSYPGGRFIILMENLEHRNIQVHWMGDNCSIETARKVAIALGHIHATYWNSERFMSDMVWVRPRTRRFGENWMRETFDRSQKAFLASELGETCPAYVRDLITEWNKHSPLCHAYFDTKPATLVHGDSHLGNILEYPDGRAGYYDWQCLYRGYGLRDLAYFMMSALTVDDVKLHDRKLFNIYTNTLKEHGIELHEEEAWADYNLLRMDRFDSAMVSTTQGAGYGHARHAFERQVKTLSYIVEKEDVASILRNVVETGHVLRGDTKAVVFGQNGC